MDSFQSMHQKISLSVSPESCEDVGLFRPNALVAALMLSLMVSPVCHAETIVYESGPLRSNPLMAGKALFPDAASGNSVTNIGNVDGSMFGGMSTDRIVENNTVYAKAGVSQYVMGGISGDTDARNNQVFVDGAIHVGTVYGADTEGRGSAVGNSVSLKNGVDVWLSVLGGFSTDGDARDNRVTIENSTVGTDLMGGASLGNGAVSNNHVLVSGSTVGDEIYAGYGDGNGAVSGNSVTLVNTEAKGIAFGGISSNGNVLDNRVTLSGGSVAKDVVGGMNEGSGLVSGNRVTVDGTKIGGSVTGGQSSSGSVAGNMVGISGGSVAGDVYGGFTTGTNWVSGNKVELLDADVTGAVAGGVSVNGNASNNQVSIRGKTFSGDISGAVAAGDVSGNTVTLDQVTATAGTISGGYGFGSLPNARVSNNSVMVNNSTVGLLYGGLDEKGASTVSGNRVTVTGGTASHVYGGSAFSGNAIGNVVDLTGVAVLSGNVTGGRSLDGSATGNTVTVTDGKVAGNIVGGYAVNGKGNATGNTVIIKGNADIRDAFLFGGKTDAPDSGADVRTGNTLQIWTSGQVTQNVANFENFQFIVTPSMMRKSRSAGDDALLTLLDNNRTDLSNSNISIAVAAGAPVLDIGSGVTLFQNDAGIDMNGARQKEISGVQGVSLEYKIDLNLDDSGKMSAVVKDVVAVKQSTSVFSTGRMATMGFLNQGTDFSLGDGLTRATGVAAKQGAGFYGAMSAGDFRYDTGSTSRSSASGQSVLLGLAAKLDSSKDHDVIGSAYVEAGWGSIDDHTSEARGDGNTHYYGVGLMAKYRQNEGMLKGAYGQVNAKIGRVNTDFKSNLVSAEGKRGAYDRTATYVGAGVGAGYVTALGSRMSLDVSAAYQWTRLKGYDASVADDPYHFDDIDSHRTKLGARLNFTHDTQFTPYVGLAWEHEFSGTAKGTVYGLDLETLSMKGDSGMGEVGIQFKPGTTSAWTVDAAVKGYVGQREGVAGRLMVNYRF